MPEDKQTEAGQDQQTGAAHDGEVPAVAFTDDAIEKLSDVIGNHANPVAGLRLQIAGRQGGEFQHMLSLVEDGAQVEGDLEVESDGIRVYIEPRSAAYLDGVRVDYSEDVPGQGRLVFHNPNPLWRDEREQSLQRLFDEQINPQIAAHGGVVNLLAVDDDTAFIEFGGGCVGCGMLNVTLKQGVEVAIFDVEPSIKRVVDSTDHASGTNPYYKPSKK